MFWRFIGRRGKRERFNRDIYMASEVRITRINELIKRELGKIILREIDFPRGILVTLTNVDTASDLQETKVFFSVFPETEKQNALKILKYNVGFLQHLLNRTLRMRPVPKIIFQHDKELSEAQKVEQIIEKVKIKE